MYSNVKTLLQNERHPEFYSLDMETDNENYLGTENPIERFYMYKSGNVDKQSVYEGAVRYRELNEEISKSIIDCDSCDLAKDVYFLYRCAKNYYLLLNCKKNEVTTTAIKELNITKSSEC